MHSVIPSVSWKKPGVHSLHLPESPYVPGGQFTEEKKVKNMSQSTYANCKLTREMMIHLQKLQRLTTTFGISHD